MTDKESAQVINLERIRKNIKPQPKRFKIDTGIAAGDEVLRIDGPDVNARTKGVVTRADPGGRLYVVVEDGTTAVWNESECIRTGQNFIKIVNALL